jgi:tryptophan-rich sensory protein
MYENEWYSKLKKSPLNPQPRVFSIAWTILYIMIFLSIFIYTRGKYDTVGITLFSIQLFLNLIWVYIFFTLKNPKLALLDIVLLWVFVVLTIYKFYSHNKVSAYLLMPYLIWISFAMYLNYYIVANNDV